MSDICHDRYIKRKLYCSKVTGIKLCQTVCVFTDGDLKKNPAKFFCCHCLLLQKEIGNSVFFLIFPVNKIRNR